jgi:hypothetical protein
MQVMFRNAGFPEFLVCRVRSGSYSISQELAELEGDCHTVVFP